MTGLLVAEIVVSELGYAAEMGKYNCAKCIGKTDPAAYKCQDCFSADYVNAVADAALNAPFDSDYKDYRLEPDFDPDSETEAERVCIETY